MNALRTKNLVEGLIPPGSFSCKFFIRIIPVTGTRVDELRIGDRIMVKFSLTQRQRIMLLISFH